MINKVLENIGLNEKEAKIYIACLQLGPSTVSEIAKQASINRVSTYDILEKLIKKGFVNFFTKDKIKLFSATDPEIIMYETKRKTDELKKVLPDLKKLHGKASHANIQYYEGLEGIKTMYADTLNSKSEICNYANSKIIREYWPEYDEEYVKQRIKKKIFLKGIAPYDEYGIKVQSDDKASYREIRLVSGKEYTFTNEINIYDDKVAITAFKDGLIGMVMHSKAIADTQRDIFKMAWEYAGNIKFIDQ